MKILIDTSVWSLVLRRKQPDLRIAAQLKEFIEGDEQIYLPGIVLQEVLSGISDVKLFKRLVNYFSAFPLIDPEREDYIEAAKLKNSCQRKGVQASTIDFLLASVCQRNNLLLFSADKDFQSIARVSPLKLIKV